MIIYGEELKMVKSIIKDKWEYEVIKCNGEGLKGYGYQLAIYRNDILVYCQSGFGSELIAEVTARDYFLSTEFNIDRDL